MAPDEEGAVNMDELLKPRKRLDEIVRFALKWRRLINTLHDEAGITSAYDPELMELVIDHIEEAIRDEIVSIYESPERRRELIHEWREKKNAAAATAARA